MIDKKNIIITEKVQKLLDLVKEENWDKVDELLKNSEYCDDKDVVSWSRVNILNENWDLADLSASVLEATNLWKLMEQDIEKLIQLMRKEDKEYYYASFRAACALANHFKEVNLNNIQTWTNLYKLIWEKEEPKETLKQEIIKKLEKYKNDKDVADIAKHYSEFPWNYFIYN